MKGTLLGKQSMFSSVPMLLLEEIPWIIILNQFLLMCYKHSKFFFL